MPSVIVLGGYGLFGQYVCQGLLRMSDCTVWVAGRNANAAADCCQRMHAHPTSSAKPLALEATRVDLSAALRATAANILIHCAGPFQNQDYHVAKAAIVAGMHYIDLADSGEFVVGIAQLHQQALAANVAVYSGASSVPALSSAVISQLTEGWTAVHDIDIGISPGNQTPRGLATMQAILSYSGAAISAWRDGKPAQAFGWLRPRRMRYANPVGARWLVDCDVPDLRLLPERYPTLKRLQFGAGLELKSLHFGLYAMAHARRLGLVPNLAIFAKLFKRISELFLHFGSNQGAMHVRVKGLRGQQAVEQTWQLIAENGAGPSVPAAASIAIAKALLQGTLTFRGARPALEVLPLQHYLDELDPASVRTATRAH